LKKYSTHINTGLLIAIAFCIPIHKKILPYLILFLFINWLATSSFKTKFLFLKSNLRAFIFLTSFYIWHIVSLLYTDNLKYGFFDLEVKLSLFIFPLIMLSSEQLSQALYKRIAFGFLSGCFISILINLGHSLYLHHVLHVQNAFIYTQFTMWFHPSYYALYLNFAIVILLGFILSYHLNRKHVFMCILLVLIFSIGILLANSKAVIISLVFTLIIFGFIYAVQKRKWLFTSVFFTVFLGGIMLSIYAFPQLNKRLVATQKIVEGYLQNKPLNGYDGSSQRILIWQSTIGIIKNNFFWGVGNGDIKDVLIEDYTQNNYTYILEKRLNSHNQFLQSFAALGLIGFIFLIMLFIVPLSCIFKKRNYIYFFFLLIVFMNFLTESMLEVQAGVLFISFLNTLLYKQLCFNS